MWASLKKAMGSRWHAQRHEDVLAQGIPDVSYGASGVQGWIELKCLEAWPVRPDTVVKIDHLTQEQRAWLYLRGKAGGRTWLLLRVESTNTWLLFDHVRAWGMVGRLKQADLRGVATKVWEPGIDADELARAVSA